MGFKTPPFSKSSRVVVGPFSALGSAGAMENRAALNVAIRTDFFSDSVIPSWLLG